MIRAKGFFSMRCYQWNGVMGGEGKRGGETVGSVVHCEKAGILCIVKNNKGDLLICFPMPSEHLLISTQIRCETGPTVVGDMDSDPKMMAFLDAQKVYRFGNTFPEFITEWPPRKVLDRLSELGFSICGMAGTGQTMIWTMKREKAKENKET
ncbi:hypothetical protein GPALN_005429 [Globodera pallida]|nr:hypothetical protein GPALN_005429 [Globodera pallida]